MLLVCSLLWCSFMLVLVYCIVGLVFSFFSMCCSLVGVRWFCRWIIFVFMFSWCIICGFSVLVCVVLLVRLVWVSVDCMVDSLVEWLLVVVLLVWYLMMMWLVFGWVVLVWCIGLWVGSLVVWMVFIVVIDSMVVVSILMWRFCFLIMLNFFFGLWIELILWLLFFDDFWLV